MTAPTKPYINTSALKVLKVLTALQGNCLQGLSNTDLSQNLGESPATVSRACNTLVEAGLVTQLENGRYAHSIKMLQIAQATANELARANNRISELTQRINAF